MANTRFAALKNKLANNAGVTDPAALAAAIGRKKYGTGQFEAMAKKKKHKKHH